MATVEIDENEYAELKRVGEIAGLINKNPEAVRKLQEAVELAAPDRIGPEIRIRREVNERLGGIEKRLDEFFDGQKKAAEERQAAEAEARLRGQWNDGRRKLRDKGWNDDGLTKVEELMEKRGIADHEAAAALFEIENPPPEPVSTGGSRFNFFDMPKDDTSIDALLKGHDEDFLNQAIPRALKEVRGR